MQKHSIVTIAAACALLVLCVTFPVRSASRPEEIPFEKHTLDLGATETAAIADINGDGRLDIVSGENWYEAPHWTKHHFRDILIHQQLHRRSQHAAPGCGWRRPHRSRDLRLVQQEAGLVAKSRQDGRTWKEHPIETGYPIEFAFLVDLDNDGKARRDPAAIRRRESASRLV